MIKKVKSTYLKGDEVVRMFYEKELQKSNQKELGVE